MFTVSQYTVRGAAALIRRYAGPKAFPGPLLQLLLLAAPSGVMAQAFPDRVTEFVPGISSPGTTVTFGADYFPNNVLGPPMGTLTGYVPTASPAHLLSLGNGGTITLEFSSNIIVDGPGPDFTIFENPVAYQNYPEKSFVEAATVSVSEDGTSWTTFPFNFIPPENPSSDGIPFELYDMDRYIGFAGIRPVFSSPTNGISPFDPAVSGGDSFDLADIGVSRVHFIRIRDTGTTGPTQTVDPDGEIVTDPGNYLYGTETAGFDLDAVAAIHTTSSFSSVRHEEWCLYE